MCLVSPSLVWGMFMGLYKSIAQTIMDPSQLASAMQKGSLQCAQLWCRDLLSYHDLISGNDVYHTEVYTN